MRRNRTRWLPDYREISTASGAVHSPPPGLWQTIGKAFWGRFTLAGGSATIHPDVMIQCGCMTNLYRLADQRARRRIVSFDRRELSRLLSLYSMRVASGEWRDYAIDFRPGMAIFSIFRHTAEQPLFAIAKVPGAARAATWSTTARASSPTAKSLEDVLAHLRPQAQAAAGLSGPSSYLSVAVAAPMPAPTAAPTSAGASSGQPARRRRRGPCRRRCRRQ